MVDRERIKKYVIRIHTYYYEKLQRALSEPFDKKKGEQTIQEIIVVKLRGAYARVYTHTYYTFV